MNQHLHPDMEDTANNNVDENSNDHQYNDYANYHDQYTNHQYRGPILRNANLEEREHYIDRESDQRYNYEAQADMQQRRNGPMNFPVNHRHVDSHRRNLSEDLSLNSHNLPPLPRTNPNAPRNRLLNSSNWLPPLPSRRRRPTPTEEEIRKEGKEIFCNFAAEQLKKENIDLHSYLEPDDYHAVTPAWQRAGRDLRKLADEFSRSQERKQLRNKAKDVDMSSLTMENFFQLCSELFHMGEGGVTQERIVVLFTFISDVAIQQVRRRAEQFISTLMEWSLRFIYERICSLVREAGGWGVVFSHGANFIYKLTIFVCASVATAALGTYVIKNWEKLRLV